MTVAELRKALEGLPDNALVVLAVEEYLRRAKTIEQENGKLEWEFYTNTIRPGNDPLVLIS